MIFSGLLRFSLIATFIIFCFGATLVPDEIETLKEIGNTLGKKWDFTVDPCSGNSGWITPSGGTDQAFNNSVICNCSFYINADTAVCHIIAIVLKAQNLNGTLPKALVNLTYLQQFDVTYNYLNGTIPPEWGSTKLVDISLVGNRLTGHLPKELGSITTLTSLNVESNQLSGIIPPELGNLAKIERLVLASNDFTGKLDETFARLTTLKEFRISGNRFTGRIPNFITKWTNLTILGLLASGMDGPIPSEIGLLGKMVNLRISDINGTESPFPQLDTMTDLHTLMLRSCNIIGQLPNYFEKMTNLRVLDLSFNKLHGEIPSKHNLKNIRQIFLTGNLLTGDVPGWILDGNDNIDLSYNNLTDPKLGTCQHRMVNLFGSSLKGNKSGILCLRNNVCPQNLSSSFHINCGGNRVTEGGIIYEEDTDLAGPSTFHESVGSNWALSNTGYFPDDGNNTDSYILTNTSSLTIDNSQLYMNARLSPLSLTYYGFCLANGNYIVDLHFAEIKFTNDSTYFSLGRRIFDVYIQGMLALKDFNIAEAAGGVGKKYIYTNTTTVTTNTLEIRFHWAGKGTAVIPHGGVYGPLISAISVVNPSYKPPKSDSFSAGAVVGIVAAVAVFVLLVLGILWWKGCLRREELANELRGLDLQTGSFTLRQIKAATNNFDIANKIGEGGFGSVYKGLLSDGIIIAVKQLSSKSKQGNREFLNEIGMISALQHPHLVKLYGCCVEGNQLLLVYEYMENNSLARALFEESQLILDWPTRHKICVGIARGLAFLHEESRLKIVHRDIKATNVLLDKNLDPKISDFGLAKLDEEDKTHISTRIAGTYGYMAPEYAMRGYLTDKADVYSFGIVALEIASGRSNTSIKSRNNPFYLLDWALVLKQKGRLLELIDPKLGNKYNQKEVLVMINVALLCTNVSPAVRPSMSSVVSMLEGKTTVNEIASYPSLFYDENEMHSIPMEDQYQHSQGKSLIDSQIHSDEPWSGSSTSAADHYPNQPENSDYWQSRA